MNSWKSKAAELLPPIHARDGVLTEELVLTPGKFGLGKVPARMAPDATANMVCGFCATGCGLKVHLRDGEALNLSADPAYPVNLGMACPKGWEALAPLDAPDRATVPLLRGTDGKLTPTSWESAAHLFTAEFKRIIAAHGRESVAWLGTGQIPTEELAYLGAFAKFGMGMLHGDGNTRQCMATAARAYKESFGFDAPPYTYADFEQSDVVILIGSNLCITHPIMWQRVVRNRHNCNIVVIDPRKTETAMAATSHYPLRPKSDLTLFYGLTNILIASGWINREFIENHTTGFDELAEGVRPYTTEAITDATGLSSAEVWRLARTIADGKRVSFWWTMGVNQGHEATRTAQAIINLALITGNIGRPGTGANSITGQCNAMGSRLFSNTTNLLGGHDFGRIEDRRKVAETLGIDEERIPTRSSLAYDQIMERVAEGRIKGLWIIATNTAHSWINQRSAREALSKLEFLVVQDMYHNTETVQHAHLLLPAAGWGEKEGTFINSERRIGVIRKVRKPPGQAMADLHIFRLLASAWGCGELFSGWRKAEDVFQSLKALSRGQPCDITGIAGYDALEAAGGIQWPCPAGENETAQERRLFADGRFFTKDGRAHLVFENTVSSPEQPSAEFPFWLLTGRGSSAQWHTLTRTSKSPILSKLAPTEIYAEINALDAGERGIQSGDKLRVRSRRGELEAVAVCTGSVQRGQIFIPMHFHETNRLTASTFDPYSRQPSYKACAVAMERSR